MVLLTIYPIISLFTFSIFTFSFVPFVAINMDKKGSNSGDHLYSKVPNSSPPKPDVKEPPKNDDAKV